MQKYIRLFNLRYLLVAALCFGSLRLAAQDAAPTVESAGRAEVGPFYVGAVYEQRLASRLSLVGHFDLAAEWGKEVYDNPNTKFGGFVPVFRLEGRWYYSGVRPGNYGGYLALRSHLTWNGARFLGAAGYDDFHRISYAFDAGWGYNLRLGKRWMAFGYAGLGLPERQLYKLPNLPSRWYKDRNWNLVLNLGVGFRL